MWRHHRRHRRETSRAAPGVAGAVILSIVAALSCWPSMTWAQLDIFKKQGDSGQKQAAGSGQTRSKDAESTAIPVSDIGKAADEAITKLQVIRTLKLLPDPAAAKISAELPLLLKSLQELKESQKRRNLLQLQPRQLHDLKQQWMHYKGRLDRWQARLSSRSQILEVTAADLRGMKEVWEKTLREAPAKGAPETLTERVRIVLRETGEVESELKKRFDTLLTLQAQISKETTVITDVLAEIEKAAELARQGLLVRDTIPLWETSPEDFRGVSLSREIQEVLRDKARNFEVFVNTYGQRTLFHLAIFGGLFFFLRRGRHRVSAPVAGIPRVLGEPIFTFEEPLSSATLISLLLTPFIYPLAPFDVALLVLFLSIIPVVRLLPGSVHSSLYGLFALTIIIQLLDVSVAGALLTRLLLLITASLSIAYLIWFFRWKKSPLRMASARWQGPLVALARTGIVLFGGSIIANVLGNVTLAETLTKATLGSAYFGTMLLTGVWVVDDMYTFLLQTSSAQKLYLVRGHAEILRKRGIVLIHVAAGILWLASTLYAYAILDSLLAVFSGALSRQWTIGKLAVSLADILIFFGILILTYTFARVVQFVLREGLFLRLGFARGVSEAILMLFRYALFTLGFLFALSAAGIDMTRFTIIAGALGVGVGFGLQAIVNNFVSGLILAFERPVHVGDIIQTGTVTGRVEKIGIRSTIIRSFEGAEVIIPNGELISKEVTNWTLTDRNRRIDIPVGVAYGTDPHRVIGIMLQVARDHQEILKEPEPAAFFQGFGESSLNFQLMCWTPNFDRWIRVKSELTIALNDRINEAGVEIPFPQRDVHLKSVAPSGGNVPEQTDHENKR